MAENDAEKTEAPTPRRVQEARQDGNVARSPDLTAACILFAAVLLLYFMGNQVFGGMKVALQQQLSGAFAVDNNPAQPTDVGRLAQSSVYMLFRAVGPVLVCIFVISLVVTVVQVGFLLTPKPLQPKFSRISPIKGIANLFNARSAIKLMMSLLKVIIISAVAFVLIRADLIQILHIGELPPRQAILVMGYLLFKFAIIIAVILFVLALIDYAFQRWNHTRDLRMTKQEVKEEMKRMEGDPLVKQRRTQVARQLAMQRIAQAVPTADVIVTNPTHFAVALKYDSDDMRAPRVVAKGADYMAMRIRQIAATHDIPIVERKPLARALYNTVEIGQEIPSEHYAAVAEILAYVYRIGSGSSGSSSTTRRRPEAALN
ncbi:flagellar biosynthesis protein FlhB [Poriferisphaera sp. WC338]|uniref:flagellar biosynthesis protein FlhB n=1 Tax=Poriferisphaera sp. WC338 TaxID=3425129 RepID=UPI003D81771B